MFNEYLAWLELQTWTLDEGGLTFYSDNGPRAFMIAEDGSGSWFEFKSEAAEDEDLIAVTDPQLIEVLHTKYKELRTN